MNIFLENDPTCGPSLVIEITGKAYLITTTTQLMDPFTELGLAAVEISAGAAYAVAEFDPDQGGPYLELKRVPGDPERLGCVLAWPENSARNGGPGKEVAGIETMAARDFATMVLCLLTDTADQSGKDAYERHRDRCVVSDAIRNRLFKNLKIDWFEFRKKRMAAKASPAQEKMRPTINAAWVWQPIIRTCPHCKESYAWGHTGSMDGCDRCLGIERDGCGLAWRPRTEKKVGRTPMGEKFTLTRERAFAKNTTCCPWRAVLCRNVEPLGNQR